MKRWLLLFVAAVCPVAVFGQAQRIDNYALLNTGSFVKAASGAVVTVCTSAGTGTPCTPLATTYTSVTLGTPTTNTTPGLAQVCGQTPSTNPCLSDANGNFGFWVAPGPVYIVTITGGGLAPSTYTITSVITGPGNNTLTGQNTLAAYLINGATYVDGNKYACTAAGINSAITAQASTGGVVNALGCPAITSQSTTVTVGTAGTQYGVALLLPCSYSGSANPLFFVNLRSRLVFDACTVVTQTSNTANGVIVAGTFGGSALSGGIDGRGAIVGTGAGVSTSAGLILGGTSDTGNAVGNSCNYCYIGPITVTGFGTGEIIGNNVYSVKHDHTQIYANTNPLSIPATSTGSAEALVWDSVNFAKPSGSYGTITLGASTEVKFLGSCNFDGNVIVINASSAVRAFFETPHMEYVLGATNADIITTSGSTSHVVTIQGGEVIEDSVSTRTQFITNGAGTLTIYNTLFLPQETVTAVVNATGTAATAVFGVGTNNISSLVSGGSTAGTIQTSVNMPGVGGANIRMPNGLMTSFQYATNTNCANNGVSPTACGTSSSGAFVVPTTTTTYTVNTTAVTAASRIFLFPMTFAGNLPTAPTCVAPAVTSSPSISAISAGVSFTMALPSTTGQTCWQYWIID